MSKAFLTAVVTTLALGSFAPRLAAQDTASSAGRVRPDTSGYAGAGGVDTTERPGRVGATDTIMLDSADTGGAVGDSAGAMTDTAEAVTDTAAKPSTGTAYPSDSGSAADTGKSGWSSDSSGMVEPSTQPSQSTSPSGPNGRSNH